LMRFASSFNAFYILLKPMIFGGQRS